MTSLKVNLTNQSRGKTPSVTSIPSLNLGTDISKVNPYSTGDIPSKSLIQELQKGMQILKENTQIFKTLRSSSRKSARFEEDKQSNIKTLDFRKIKKNTETLNSSSRMMTELQDRIRLLSESEKPAPTRPHRYAEIDTSLSDLSFRHLGRGLDPTPDIVDSFMHKTPRNPSESKQISLPATTYHVQYADYLAKKQIEEEEKLRSIEVPKAEPKEIQSLRVLFSGLDRLRRGLVDKSALYAEILKNSEFVEMFGGEENLKECMENAESEAINIEEFLTIYQVSKNNLLKNVVNKQAVNEIQQEKQTKQRELAKSLSRKPLNITVPKPFSFTTREGRKEESIRQRKLREMLEEKEKDTEEQLKIKFEAKPVPPEVIIPLYDQIMQEQEERRKQVKEQSIAITKASEKPFSFYYRDQEKPKVVDEAPAEYRFKANPVPRDSQILKMHEFQQLEEQRKLRIQRNARELYMQSSLPPRMAMHAQRTSVTPHPRVEMTFKFRANTVPDFETLQNNFQRTLDTVKQNQTKTIPQPFNFQESRRLCKYAQLLDEVPTAHEKWGEAKKRSKSLSALSKPKYIIKPTEKLKEMYKLKEKKIELDKQKKQQIRDEGRAREEKRTSVRQQVHSCTLIKDTNKFIRRQAEYNMLKRIAEARQHERAYEFFKAQMLESIRRRPLLVEMVGREQSEEEFGLEQIQEHFDEEDYTREYGDRSERYSF